MNKERRKAVAALVSQIDGVADALESLASEEREAFENMPESLQQSERGETSSQAADALETAAEAARTLEDSLNEVDGL